MTEMKTRGGRSAYLADNSNLLAALVAVREGGESAPSRTICLQLVERKLVEIQKVKTGEGRGAPMHNYVLTGQGKSRIALLSANLSRAALKAAHAAVADAAATVAVAQAALDAANTTHTAAVANAAAMQAEHDATKIEPVAEVAETPVEPVAEMTESVEEVAETPETVEA